MDRKSTRPRQESIEVEVIPPHAHQNKTTNVTSSAVEKPIHRRATSKKTKKTAKLETTQVETDANGQWGIIDNSSDYQVHSTKPDKEDDKKYCEFCGSLLEDQFGALLAQRRKYCSPRCRSIATGRRTRARLGVRPTRHEISKLNPLYFN
jgi:hypothetical protein